MSMKRLSKKLLAVVAAGAMTMGLAMPVFADGTTTPDNKNNAKKAYVSKTYQTEVKKEMKFNFTATQVTAEGREDLIKTSVACTIPSIEFKESDFNSNSGSYKKVSGEITFDNFTEAGKYEYTVTESEITDPVVNNSDHEKLIMSKAVYTMDVYVVEKTGGTFEIEKIIVTKTMNDKGESDSTTGKVDIGDDAGKNGFNFTNTYVQEAGTGTDPTNPNPDPDDYTKYGSLNVAKKVILNTADNAATLPTDKFDFTVKFEFPAGTDATTLGGVKKNGEAVTLATDGTTTFQLGHNENMKFTGLPVGTKITVTETAKANYKASASVVLNGGEATTVATTKYNELLTAVNGDKLGQNKLGQNKNTVDVTNRYNNVPTTGIIMNTLPYVLMIALCGAALFGFVAFKRRR